MILCPFLLCCVLLGVLSTADSRPYHDYCIIGAGPSGLQLGYFMQKNGRDYVVFERGDRPGTFFSQYPRHRKLISVNKRHTGQLNKGFSFRHDWNSLISEDESLQLKHYSTDLFPSADVLVKYLQDFRTKSKINVQFNTEIKNLRPESIDHSQGVRYLMEDQEGNPYTCRTVIVATGMWKPNIPNIPGIENALGYESFPTAPELYENKSVLILGMGNSAMETADSIYGHTQYVHILTRQPSINMAWDTHYVGDVRSINNNILDTFLLKSLDGITFLDLEDVTLHEREGKYYVIVGGHYMGSDDNLDNIPDNFALRGGYDVVIRCTGFTFDTSIFNSTNISRPPGKAKKYPAISHAYESIDFPGLFVAGTASHSLDFRKSAGGFIHGFRYTSQALSRLLEWRYEGIRWPSTTIPLDQVLNLIVKRLNEGSGFYQMFGILGDVVIIDRENNTATYLEEFPVNLLPHLLATTGHQAKEVLVVILDYGAPDMYTSKFEAVASEAHKSYFLHPILFHYRQLPTEHDFLHKHPYDRLPRPDSIHHVVEDFLVVWQSTNEHIRPLRRWIESVLNKNLRQYFSDTCFEMAMTYTSVPGSCERGLLQGQGLFGTSELRDAAKTRRVVMASLY